MTRGKNALFDIYRVDCVPAEPPTIDSAQNMFQSLFFDSERYGPVRGRPRQDEHAPRTRRAPTPIATLRKEDNSSAVIKTLVDLRDGKGRDRRHIDHLGNPAVLRSVGELMENQYRHWPAAHGARHQGAHVQRRYRQP